MEQVMHQLKVLLEKQDNANVGNIGNIQEVHSPVLIIEEPGPEWSACPEVPDVNKFLEASGSS